MNVTTRLIVLLIVVILGGGSVTEDGAPRRVSGATVGWLQLARRWQQQRPELTTHVFAKSPRIFHPTSAKDLPRNCFLRGLNALGSTLPPCLGHSWSQPVVSNRPSHPVRLSIKRWSSNSAARRSAKNIRWLVAD